MEVVEEQPRAEAGISFSQEVKAILKSKGFSGEEQISPTNRRLKVEGGSLEIARLSQWDVNLILIEEIRSPRTRGNDTDQWFYKRTVFPIADPGASKTKTQLVDERPYISMEQNAHYVWEISEGATVSNSVLGRSRNSRRQEFKDRMAEFRIRAGSGGGNGTFGY